MVNPRGSVDGASIVTPHDAQRLRQACPDLDNWPNSWSYDQPDLAVGQRIIEVLIPFLLDLLNQGLARQTVRRHRDNLWALGGELVRRRYEDDDLARMDVSDALEQLMQGDGGPFMGSRISEAEQDSLDATCRKLRRFLSASSGPVGLPKSTHK
ncbi:hypothetical protein WKW80_37110 [Variovorax humicola]|uniref:Uncharacterized protein n=1 Tax=Variovorax humicola TaxID=1769758 RepID=A0ABU8WC85_9BURK